MNGPPKNPTRRAGEPATTGEASPPSHDAIAREAYLLWERDGYPANRELEYWVTAERKLRDQAGQASAGAKASGSQGAESKESASKPASKSTPRTRAPRAATKR